LTGINFLTQIMRQLLQLDINPDPEYMSTPAPCVPSQLISSGK